MYVGLVVGKIVGLEDIESEDGMEYDKIRGLVGTEEGVEYDIIGELVGCCT